MKKAIAKKVLVSLTIIALITCVSSVSYAQKKEKGPALQQLEAAAGKKIEDVKVPAVPAPTPVPTPAKTYEVGKSTTSTTSSFDVNTSTSTTSSFDVNKSTSTAKPSKTKP